MFEGIFDFFSDVGDSVIDFFSGDEVSTGIDIIDQINSDPSLINQATDFAGDIGVDAINAINSDPTLQKSILASIKEGASVLSPLIRAGATAFGGSTQQQRFSPQRLGTGGLRMSYSKNPDAQGPGPLRSNSPEAAHAYWRGLMLQFAGLQRALNTQGRRRDDD